MEVLNMKKDFELSEKARKEIVNFFGIYGDDVASMYNEICIAHEEISLANELDKGKELELGRVSVVLQNYRHLLDACLAK